MDHGTQAQAQDPHANRDGVGFSSALMCLKEGMAVARYGWNAGGQFVVMMPELKLAPFSQADEPRRVNDRTAKWIGADTPLDCRPYFALYNAQKQWQPGWVPSTGDLLAEDWYVREHLPLQAPAAP